MNYDTIYLLICLTIVLLEQPSLDDKVVRLDILA